jgi:hypothetical protein
MDPTLYRQSANRWLLDRQPYSLASFYPPKDLVIFISVRGCVNTRAMVRLEELGKLKNFDDLVGTRTCDLPAYSRARQLSTLPCVTLSHICSKIFLFL